MSPDDEPLHIYPTFYSDLGRIRQLDRKRSKEVENRLSAAVDLLLENPRSSKPPVTIYDEEEDIWEYWFHPRYSFLYTYEDIDDINTGKTVRHYYLLRVLRKQE